MDNSNGQRENIIYLARRFVLFNCLILDTETTGLNEDDEVVEIAIIDAAGTLEFSSLVKPSKSIPEGATKVHGITNAMVSQASDAATLWPSIRGLLIGRPILAYNSPFDEGFVRRTFAVKDELEWHCLMDAWVRFHGLVRWQRLDRACELIGAEVGGHRALGDAKAAREVLRWLARQEA